MIKHLLKASFLLVLSHRGKRKAFKEKLKIFKIPSFFSLISFEAKHDLDKILIHFLKSFCAGDESHLKTIKYGRKVTGLKGSKTDNILRGFD